MNWREAMKAMLDGKMVTITNIAGEPITGYMHWPRTEKSMIWSEDTLAGYYFPSCEFEIYEEPKPEIELGPEHVGKRVRLRNGDISLITDYERDEETFHSSNNVWKNDGKYRDMSIENSNYDIVEILD